MTRHSRASHQCPFIAGVGHQTRSGPSGSSVQNPLRLTKPGLGGKGKQVEWGMTMHIAVEMRRAGAVIGWVMLVAAMTAGASAEDLRARGAYLVNSIAGCGNCHTPKDRAGRAIAGKELSGGLEF